MGAVLRVSGVRRLPEVRVGFRIFRDLCGSVTSVLSFCFFALLPLLVFPSMICAQSRGGSQAESSSRAVREVTDGTGRTVKVAARIERIVSLAPNLTETVFALGQQAGLVGVTDYCDYPPQALKLPKVGGAINPSLERIVQMKPDVVLATTALNRRETVDALEQLRVPVFGTSDPRTVEEVLDSIALIAKLLETGERGAALLADLRARLDALRERLAERKPTRALFVVWHDPLITVGRGTFIADALRRSGAQSVIELEEDWPRISLEEVVRLNPEVLIFASSHSDGVAQTFETLATRPGWRDLRAVRERRYAVISDAVNRPAPRLVAAIEELAKQLHPDAFAAKQEESSEKRKGKRENRPAITTAGAMAWQCNHGSRFHLSIFSFPFSRVW